MKSLCPNCKIYQQEHKKRSENMLWLIKENASHQIVSCNIHNANNTFELWITRPNDKNLKIVESTQLEDVTTIKEAIDYAIENGIPALRL